MNLTVPRQSGKTTLLLSILLERALGRPRQSIRYTAQTGADARKKWMDDWLPILEPSPFHRHFRTRLTNGHEALLFKNGSHQGLLATTKKTGHGGTIDLGILDEAFAHTDARLEQALKPAMITRPQPQLWVVSTAGTPEDSPYLWGKVERGRELVGRGINHSVAYFEWSASDDLDPTDPATWWSCMPALGRTVDEATIRADLESMELNEFERAYLNRWKTALTDPVIALELWKALTDSNSKPLDPVCFAFDITPDRSRASISIAAKRWDDLIHLETVENQPGTGWVVPRLLELVQKHKPVGVVCDVTGPAGALIADLAAAGLEPETVNSTQHAQACGMLFDAVAEKKIRHLGTTDLIAALDGAVKRPLTDSWAWSRKNSSVDISPLVAATLALWGLSTLTPETSLVAVAFA